MFSGFKNFFKPSQKVQNIEKENDFIEKYENDNSENFSGEPTAERTGDYLEKEEEKMRFRLAMDIFKIDDVTKSNFDVNLYDTLKMFETFYNEKLKNWK